MLGTAKTVLGTANNALHYNAGTLALQHHQRQAIALEQISVFGLTYSVLGTKFAAATCTRMPGNRYQYDVYDMHVCKAPEAISGIVWFRIYIG